MNADGLRVYSPIVLKLVSFTAQNSPQKTILDNSPNRLTLHPYLGLCLGLLAVSSASIFIRYAQADGAPSLVIAAYRLTLATVVILPVALLHHRAELRRLGAWEWGRVAASGVFLGLHFGTWISSLEYTTVANSVVFVSTAPLFVALMAAIFLKEKLTRWVLFGLALALAGSVLVGLADACSAEGGCPPLSAFLQGSGFFGDMLALAGAVTVAAYIILGRTVRAGMSLIVYILLTYGTAALTLIVSVFLLRGSFMGFAPAEFGQSLLAGGLSWGVCVILLALVPQLIGHTAYNWALKYLPATFVSVTVLGEPLGSIVLAYWLLGETPTLWKLIGGAFILLGIVIAARRESKS